jgi:O-antigen/teichoic acid export membrane protein
MSALSIDYIKEKWSHAGFQKYLQNMSWMFLGRIFSLILSLFVSVYMARNLGVENFGTLNFIISFVSIAGPCLFVIESILLKKLIHEPENTNKILGSAFLIKIISSILIVITTTTTSIIFANSKTTTVLVFIFSTFAIFQSIHIIDYYFQAKANIKKVVPANILITLLPP